MSTRGQYLVGMLVLLFLANICMLLGMTNWPQQTREKFTEHFMSPLVASEGSKNRFGTASMGSYDGVNVAAGLPAISGGWRGTLPNEPLAGPNVDAVDLDNLFIFKNNQCKPECCGSTLSCDGGCVCTTPAQRNLINTRGGNRTEDDGF